MTDIAIIPFCEQLLDAVEGIERSCFCDPWSRDMLKSELFNPPAHFFVAMSENTAVGYAGMHSVAGECYVANIGVLPQYRRMGVAQRLLDTLESCAQRENAEFITLEVRESNLPAISLYEKSGYKRVGLRRSYYSNPCEDAILMTKYL